MSELTLRDIATCLERSANELHFNRQKIETLRCLVRFLVDRDPKIAEDLDAEECLDALGIEHMFDPTFDDVSLGDTTARRLSIGGQSWKLTETEDGLDLVEVLQSALEGTSK
jgi:hypothetical protein